MQWNVRRGLLADAQATMDAGCVEMPSLDQPALSHTGEFLIINRLKKVYKQYPIERSRHKYVHGN